MRRLLLLVVLNAIYLSVAANVSVEARIDSIEMFIGQQVHVTVSATTDKPSAVVFPAFGSQQMIIPGVEVLGTDEVPEETIENGMRYSRIYTLTSFDANLYYLPPFEVSVDGKKYKSKSLALKVLTVNVDTTNVDQFFGIKDVQDNPFMWSDWSGIFWNSVLLLVLAVFGGYLYLRMRDNKPIIKRIRIIKRLLPHQKAMKSIEEIKSDRMTVSDNQKEYYTKLTDTLRRYIHERYGFNAMEMTSDEIIGRLMEESDRNAIDELRELFRTADLVKFAKYSTLINENDRNLVNAIEFINSTKIEKMPVEEPETPISEEDMRSHRSRMMLKAAIAVIAAACLALLVWVVYDMWQLLS